MAEGNLTVTEIPEVEVKAASKWGDVALSDTYNSATNEQKKVIQDSYYNTNIRGKAKLQGIDEDQAKESFYKYANSSIPAVVKVTNNFMASGEWKEDKIPMAFAKGFVSNIENVIPAASGLAAVLTKPAGGLATIGMKPEEINDWAFVNRKELLIGYDEAKIIDNDFTNYQAGGGPKDYKGWFFDENWRKYSMYDEKELTELHDQSIREQRGEALEGVKQGFLNKAKEYNPLIDVTPELAKRMAFKVGGGFGSVAKFSAYNLMGIGMPMMVAESTGTAYLQISRDHPGWAEKDKSIYSLASGTIEGTLEAWGSAQLLRPLEKAGSISLRSALKSSTFASLMKQGVTNFITESSQETSQEIGQNALAKLYGIDRPLFANVFDSWLIGGIVGGAFGVGTGAISYSKTMSDYNNMLTSYYKFTPAEVAEVTKIMKGITEEVMTDGEALSEAIRIFKNSSLARNESLASQKLAETMARNGASDEEIKTVMNNTDGMQREEILRERIVPETAEQTKEYETNYRQYVGKMERAGIAQEEADNQAILVDRMVTSEAIRRKISRAEVWGNLNPTVQVEYSPEYMARELAYWDERLAKESEEKKEAVRKTITEEQIKEFIDRRSYDKKIGEEEDYAALEERVGKLTPKQAVNAIIAEKLYQAEFPEIPGEEEVFPAGPEGVLYQGKRGAFQRTDGRSVITLFDDADRSTLLHETAHMFLTYYLEFNPEGLKEVMNWAGVKDLSKLTLKQYTEFQEKFARGFEVYLYEGKAPTKGMAKVFEDFKNWLQELYKSVLELNVTINDDIRNFFDEMLSIPADRKIGIDEEVAAELEGNMLYQEAKDKLDELKDRRKQIIKQYGKKAKANLIEVDQAIKDLETITFGVRRTAVVKTAETLYAELPISKVIEGKIKSTPNSKQLMDEYNIPANVRTTEETAMSLDEWAAELGVTEEEVLKQINKVKSKAQFIKAQFIKEQVEAGRAQLAAEGPVDIQAQMDAVIEKLKADAKAGSITELQKEVIQTIRNMKIDNADKVKFLGQIQKAKTPYSQRIVLMNMLDMEQHYWEKQQRNILDERIQKLLKQTRPVAQYGVTKGKYNYEDNTLFKELRDMNTLNQNEALDQLDKLEEIGEEDIMSNEEILIRGFLNYKAYGKSKGTLQLFEVVHKNLEAAIRAAKTAKDAQDFANKLERKEKTLKFLEGINSRKFKGDAKSILTKVINVYRQGSLMFGANQWSLFNSIAGKEIADAYNMEYQNMQRDNMIYEQQKDTVAQAIEILELKDATKFLEWNESMEAEEHFLIEKDPEFENNFIRREFNRKGIIDIYNAIKDEETREHYYRAYGVTEITSLVNQLSEKERAFGDMLMESVQQNKEEINKVHIEQTGVDLNFVEQYWPRTSVAPQTKINDNMGGEVVKATFQKQRSKGLITPVPVDAWAKYNSHLAGAAHVTQVSETWRGIRKVLDNSTVKNKIDTKYGSEVYQTLIKQVNALSLAGLRNETNISGDLISGMFKNWVAAKIGFNPSIFVKQLISTNNYIENMPAGEYIKYFAESLAGGKATWDFMFEVSDYLPARFSRGFSEDVQKSLSIGKRASKAKGIRDVMLSFGRMGDMAAIVFGGYPMIKYLTSPAGGSLSMKEAVKQFELATLRGQQSPLTASLDLSQQTRNPFMNFFFAFKNTPKQYSRKIADAFISYYNGDMTREQLAKTLAIYVGVQAALFGAVTQLMRSMLYGDDDDYLDDVSSSVFTSFTNAFPIFGEMNKYIVDYMIAKVLGGKKPYSVFSTPLLSDIERFMKYEVPAVFKNDIDIFDIIGAMSTPLEITTGLPIKTIERPFRKRFRK